MIIYYSEYDDAYVGLSATLDDLNEYPPERHSRVESQLYWLNLDDGLPRARHVYNFIENGNRVSISAVFCEWND